MNLNSLAIDDTWTLFIDRDGVINKRIVGGYVKQWAEFEFLEGVTEAFQIFSRIVGRIIVVSNQQGIGKGLVTFQEVDAMHQKMTDWIQTRGGRVDLVVVAPDLANSGSFLRKPAVGMALIARKKFPEIHFRKSIMVGDSLTDMLFGKRLKMKTVFLSSSLPDIRKGARWIDTAFPSLLSFAKSINDH